MSVTLELIQHQRLRYNNFPSLPHVHRTSHFRYILIVIIPFSRRTTARSPGPARFGLPGMTRSAPPQQYSSCNILHAFRAHAAHRLTPCHSPSLSVSSSLSFSLSVSLPIIHCASRHRSISTLAVEVQQ